MSAGSVMITLAPNWTFSLKLVTFACAQVLIILTSDLESDLLYFMDHICIGAKLAIFSLPNVGLVSGLSGLGSIFSYDEVASIGPLNRRSL